VKIGKTVLVLCALVLGLGAVPARGSDLIERDTIKKTLQFARTGEGRKVLADIVNGTIHVAGYDGDDVKIVVYQTIRAENASRMEAAKKEVTIDVRAEGNRVMVYEDGPWRDNRDDDRDDDSRRGDRRDRRRGHRGWDWDGYDVNFEVEMTVPSTTDFFLKTVNGEFIYVRDMTGEFDLSNINGQIEMESVAGTGSVSTINGNVKVSFTKNPSRNTSFKTLNGEIEVDFPSPPSADFKLSTMNGEVFTDFDVRGISKPTSVREKRNGKKVYNTGDSFMVRSGDGGPELTLNTLNGNIYLTLNSRNGDNR